MIQIEEGILYFLSVSLRIEADATTWYVEILEGDTVRFQSPEYTAASGSQLWQLARPFGRNDTGEMKVRVVLDGGSPTCTITASETETFFAIMATPASYTPPVVPDNGDGLAMDSATSFEVVAPVPNDNGGAQTGQDSATDYTVV